MRAVGAGGVGWGVGRDLNFGWAPELFGLRAKQTGCGKSFGWRAALRGGESSAVTQNDVTREYAIALTSQPPACCSAAARFCGCAVLRLGRLPFAVCRLPFAVCRLPFANCRLPVAVCRSEFVVAVVGPAHGLVACRGRRVTAEAAVGGSSCGHICGPCTDPRLRRRPRRWREAD